MTTRVVKIGNSKGVIIPSKILASLGFAENDELLITEREGGLHMVKTKMQMKSFAQQMEEFYGMPIEKVEEEIRWDIKEEDWGDPVGKEVW